jgi:DNA polymerase-3 subunit alpha
MTQDNFSKTKIKELFDIAFRLEGITRHASKHAAGIVITPLPVDEIMRTQDLLILQ